MSLFLAHTALALPSDPSAKWNERRCRSKPTTTASRRLLQKKYALSRDPDNKDCYLYRATGSDSIPAIATALGVSEADLRERNSANIADFSRLNGRFIQICNIGSEWRACGGNKHQGWAYTSQGAGKEGVVVSLATRLRCTSTCLQHTPKVCTHDVGCCMRLPSQHGCTAGFPLLCRLWQC